MQPRIFKRWGSSSVKQSPRKGRKGKLYVTEIPHPPPSPEEEVRIKTRRHVKAERDERMDITRAITPPKTYMGGFTRPKDLRAANWFPGGPYIQKGKIYESPPEAAYEPHTVFLLESRYRVRHGIGRVDAKDYIIGVCRAPDFVKLVAKYNSAACPSDGKESMDNACWPFLLKSGKVLKPTRWWGKDENLRDIMKEIYEDDNYDNEAVMRALRESEEEPEEEDNSQPKNIHRGPKVRPNAKEAEGRSSPLSSSMQVSKPLSSSSSTTPLPHTQSNIFDVPQIRSEFLKRLPDEPFWRPLLAVTLSTRPLALSLSRLSKALERGLPFYASITNDDRKCLFSFGQRMTCLRLNRFYQLTSDIVSRLAGYKGGFIGIRFKVDERGRGIQGEGLADPIPLDKRLVKVKVGDWYPMAKDVFELYKDMGEEQGGQDAVDVALMNEWGRRLDAQGNVVPLTEEEMVQGEVLAVDDAEDAAEDQDDEEDQEERILRNPSDPNRPKRWLLKAPLRTEDEAGAALRKKLALRYAQRHRSVTRV